MLNIWGLTDEELEVTRNLWNKFPSQIEPPDNFPIHRLEFQRFRRSAAEMADGSCTKNKKQWNAGSNQTDAWEERLIKTLIAGVNKLEVQRILPGKDENLTLI